MVQYGKTLKNTMIKVQSNTHTGRENQKYKQAGKITQQVIRTEELIKIK